MLPHVAKWLKENLNEYYVIGCGRGANLRDEQMSIAYRRDRINLISMETWWLSQTPYVPGSRYEEQRQYLKILRAVRYFDLLIHILIILVHRQERKG